MSNTDTIQGETHHNLNPSDEYELNHFLIELSVEISCAELKTLKFYLRGDGGSGEATLENIKDPLDFFKHLQHRELLSMDNLCVLEVFVWNLGRKDLYKKIVKFCRELEKTPLHFFAPKETLENGYSYVKFHVTGKARRSDVEDIRGNVARLLHVPKEFVVVAGIQPANSITITMMIPEECIFILSSLTDKEKTILVEKNIDHFTIDRAVYNLKDNGHIDDLDEDDLAVRKLMEQKDHLTKELDTCQKELLNCSRKIRQLTSEKSDKGKIVKQNTNGQVIKME